MRKMRWDDLVDYQKMYTILCAAVDEAIDPLERIPLAYAEAQKLRAALLTAEEVYIATASTEDEHTRVIPLKREN